MSRHGAEPVRYEIRLGGHLDDHWSGRFAGLALARADDGTTTLTGVVRDQAELHGLLAKARDLGVPLLSVVAVAPAGQSAPGPA